jgi:ADP-heptose:LPS heptosyltransferase
MDVARAVRQEWPAARISFVVDRPALDVVRGSGFVDDVVVYDRRDYAEGPPWRKARRTLQWISSLRGARPDIVLDLLATPQTALWTAATGAAVRVGPRSRGRTWAYNRVVEPESGVKFAGERFLDWVRALGIDPGPWRPHAPASAIAAGATGDLNLPDGAFVILNPAATWPSKAWPADSFAELARQLASRFVVRLAWGPGEESLRDEIVERASGAVEPLPATSLAELGAWIGRAALMVTTDSGPKHLAVAMGTPTLTLFGSTDPRGWQPPGAPHRWLTHPVSCHPCDLVTCPVPGHPCLDALTPSRVAAEVENMLQTEAAG